MLAWLLVLTLWPGAGLCAQKVNQLPPGQDLTSTSIGRLLDSLLWPRFERFGISIAGQNLLTNMRPEFVDLDRSTTPSSMKRGAYLKATWTFTR
jgi:hypothetical protein